MKPAFTYSEIREAEKAIIQKEGIPSLILMENAGKNAYDVITSIYPDLKNESVVIVCGKGNNAGDGFVIARHFVINSIPVSLYNFASPGELKGDALVNFDILQKLASGICIISNITKDNFDSFAKSLKKIKGNGIIIDALLGSGVKGKVTGLYENVILEVNKLKRKNHSIDVISVDVPSGLSEEVSDGAVIDACHTITMGAVKTNLLYGRGKENTGKLHVVPIGIPAEMLERFSADTKYIVELNDVRNRFPVRKKTSYKYSNGKVLVVGGSKGLSGALIMSSLSALKSGAGTVLAAFPESISAHFSRKMLEVI
ncbi:MAG: NAD(P)H-hydrate epimerase, partial [Ignavibacteria bacterium]|nr:NAD(P)H-hydrate epimerase [Ignavibacteria bacterium]